MVNNSTNPQFGIWPNLADDEIVKRVPLQEILDEEPEDTGKVDLTECLKCGDTHIAKDETGFYCKKCDTLGIAKENKDGKITYELKENFEKSRYSDD